MKSGQKFDINTGSENPFKSKLICEGVIVPNLKYLLRKNKLSEFKTEEEKAEARKNLGIDKIVEEIIEHFPIGDFSKVHIGEFNANTTTEEGWYDSVTLGRPEGSESDEKYFMYQSPNGGQVCWSRRNSGKTYHRLGNGAVSGTDYHPWVATTHDDYALEHSSSSAIKSYSRRIELNYNDFVSNVSPNIWNNGNTIQWGWNTGSSLLECYAGYSNIEVNSFQIAKPLYLYPGDIIRVRCFYRTYDNPNENIYNSDAYIYLSNQPEEGHNIEHLKSDFIKIKSLYSLDYQPKNAVNGLPSARNLFNGNEDLGWNYIKVNIPKPGLYYLQIAGDFTVTRSWFVIDKVEVYSRTLGYSYHTDGGYNINECLEQGVYYNCALGRTMDGNHSDEKYTLCVKSEWIPSENKYNVQLWAYSNNYPNRGFYRIIKTPNLTNYDMLNYGDWVQIGYEIDIPEKTYFEKVLDFEESGDESDLDFTIITEGQPTVGTITYNIHPVKLYKGLIVTGHYTTNPYSTNSIIGLLELYDESDSGEPVEVDVKDLAGDPDYGDLEGFLVLNTGIYLVYYGYDGYEQGNWIYLVYDTMESLQEKLKLAGKIDVVTILPNENESLKLKTYYRLDEPISNLSVRLPIIDSTNLETIMLSFTTDSTFEWNIETSDDIKYSSDFELDANTEYELLILWTGIGWRVTKVSFDES